MPRTVIDADGHVYEPKDLFDRYLDVPLGGRRPYVTKDDWGIDRWVIEGRLYPTPEGMGIGPKLRYGVFRPGMLDPRARLEDMDVEGIQAAVSFPSAAMAFGWGIENTDLGIAACRAYNNFLMEYCAYHPDRLKGAAALPLQDPSAAAEELRRCVAGGLVAAFVPPHYRGQYLDHPRYAPIYRAAQELDVPLMVHATTGTQLSPAAGAERFDRFFYTHTISHPFEQMLAMLAIIGGGVLEEFPSLRVGFLEAGAGYVPYWLERIDEHYEHYPKDSTPMTMSATEYFQRQCFVSCEGEERELPHAIEVLGAERILWASDYHHFDSEFPGAVAALADRRDISEADKDAIFERSARALFRFAPSAAQPVEASAS
jgi:predicted TIM-barrel fold metal-dependent hydrolase